MRLVTSASSSRSAVLSRALIRMCNAAACAAVVEAPTTTVLDVDHSREAVAAAFLLADGATRLAGDGALPRLLEA